MANLRVSQLSAAAALAGSDLLLLSQPSTSVRVSGTNISASAADNSFNDAGGRFVANGFAVGDQVVATGFSDGGTNLLSATVTAVVAGKLTIGGTDGDAIADVAAGDAVVIAKWESVRVSAAALAAFAAGSAVVQCIPVAVGDEVTPVSAAAGKVGFHLPYAFNLLEVRAGLRTAQAAGSVFTVDINADGASVLSTPITIDNTEKLSTMATTPPVIGTAALPDGAEITVDVDQIGDGTAAGLKVYLIGTVG